MPEQLAAALQAGPVTEQQHRPLNSREKVLTLKRRRNKWGALNKVLNLLAAVLLSRFMFPGNIFPAGIAFGLAISNRGLKIWEKILILGGIFFGTWSVKGLLFAGEVSGSLLIICLLNQFYFHQKRTCLKNLWPFIIWAVLRLASAGILHSDPYLFLVTGIELAISYCLTILFQISFKFLDNPLNDFSKFTLLALTLMIVLALGGTRDLVLQFLPVSLNLAEILAAFLLIIVSYIGGGGVGAAMGISIAMVLGVNTDNLIKLIVIYSIVGFLSGLLKDFRKWGTIFGASLGLYFIIQQLHLLPFLMDETLPWGIGMLSFAMVPRRYLSQIANYLPNQEFKSDSPEEQKQLREILNNRLNDLAGIFEELAGSFNDINREPPVTEKMDLYSLLDQVCTKNCQHCNGYENCWGENFYSTYREIFDLVAFAELYGEVSSKHLKGRLVKNCFQQYKLLATINQLFARCQTDYIWQRKLDESKVFLSNQLKGVSEIISSLAVEITADASFKTEIEAKIRQGFNRIGMPVNEVSVLSFREQELEIWIKQHNCNRKNECLYLAVAMISRLLDQEYTVWERSCYSDNDNCSYCLTPARNYEIKTTVCKLPKDGNEFSGDNHGLHELKDGYFVGILSDGMGQGGKASAESKTTVSILEKLLESGIDSDFAVKMVNSILLLRSTEESFATVDLAIIDLYTARAEFIKIGAAATFIKRGREIWSIKSTSLPAGILSELDLERTNMDLQAGDLVVMVTDGIVDSKIDQPGKEDWMVRALKQVEVVGPEALGEYLLNMAKINQDGVPKDDMTVIVLQLLEKEFRD